MNAQKKIIDVWLIYNCAACATSWNYPVLSRRPVRSIDESLREAFERNDPDVTRQHAFDMAGLRRLCGSVESSSSLTVDRKFIDDSAAMGDTIQFDTRYPCEIRLDRLLAAELEVSRGVLQRWEEEGVLMASPTHREPLRKIIAHGQTVCFVGLRVF